MRKKRGRYGDGSLWRPKKSRYWWCQFVDPTKKGKDGKQNLRVRRSTKCVLKKDAAIVLAGWIAETRAKTPEDDSTLTLLDLRELDLMDQALQGHRSAPRVDQAWRQILRCLDDANRHSDDPFSVYVHLPFCDHRCPPNVKPEDYLYYLNIKEKFFGIKRA